MKTLKKILLVVVIILAIPLIAALFIEKDYAVEKTVTIQKPQTQVFEYVKYLKNQDNYSKWANMDPMMTKTYQGQDGQVGFVSAWNSTDKEVGSGEQEIISIEEGKRINYELRFFEPFESTEHAYMIAQAIDSSHTEVIWGFNGHMEYPTNLLLVFMDFEKMLGDDLQTGLDQLKIVLEE
ncbi:MAG: SRPBCC family protein [Bacteroidetes bacterium]|nr:SRPBCC family protein [Bacteroidota bacterium]MBU1579626.1 SRPBCC family protein [Bacteroidota bacterium]MBU2464714.1 SRPBCC family protein [Bacteroidota bacterium]MBU2557765.1 SRPBCC family protein [Bacteroidota bacterium]